jgi:hypothetical protein
VSLSMIVSFTIGFEKDASICIVEQLFLV